MILEFWKFWNYLQNKEIVKTEVSNLFPPYINFLCDFSFIQGAWWISFPLQVIPAWMNNSNWTIELSNSSQAEIRQGQALLYKKSRREDMYSIYLMYFVNSIRFGYTKVLIQINRKAFRKSDIHEIAFIQNHPNCQKLAHGQCKNSHVTSQTSAWNLITLDYFVKTLDMLDC